MSDLYEAIQAPRFHVETIDGGERIIIKTQRNAFLVLFLTLWFCCWTVGGGFMIWTSVFQPLRLPDVFALGVWAFGEAVTLLALALMFTGAETLNTSGFDLEIGYRIAGMTWRKLFRGQDIRGLSSCPNPSLETGSITFNYGARTVYAGLHLDQAEGQLIVERLRAHLPSATVI